MVTIPPIAIVGLTQKPGVCQKTLGLYDRGIAKKQGSQRKCA